MRRVVEDDEDARRGPSADLRLAPLAAAAWSGTWLGTAGLWAVPGFPDWAQRSLPAAVGAAAVVAAGLVAMRRRSAALVAVAAVLLAGWAVGSLHAVRLTTGPVTDLARERAVVHADLVVRTDPQLRTAGSGSRAAYLTLRAQLVAVDGRGTDWRLDAPVLVVVTGGVSEWQHTVVGSRVRVLARLDRPDPGADVGAILRVRVAGELLAPPGTVLAATEHIRAGLRDAVAGRPAEPRALVPALVVGDTSRMTSELQHDFQLTGLTHLTAVSGANLTLLLAFLLPLARWCGVRGWWLRGVGLLGVAVFVVLCRAEPSVLRAAAMGLVALAALGVGGRRSGLRHLCVAVGALTLLDPFLSRSLGFALSVLACAGIVWWGSRWTQALQRWLPAVLAEAIAVPLAASVATVAVVAGISEQVSVSGLVANALTGPVVGPATVLGFAAAGLSVVCPPLAALVGWGASWCAQWIIWVAHAGATFPGSSWRWPTSPVALLVLGAGALLAGWLLHLALARWWLSLLLSLAMVGGLLTGPFQPGWPPRDWVLVACDVGQGDGLVVRSGAGEAILFDAGPDPGKIDRCLDQLQIRRLALVVLTHFHADHVDGLVGALSGRTVGEIWVSPLASPSLEAQHVRALVAAAGAGVRTPQPGERGQTGLATWTVLGPISGGAGASADPMSAESSAENDASLVVRVQAGGLTLLLTGDVEPEGQERILAAGEDVTADVLKVPHHGSARQDPAFVAATHARVAIASAGLHNDYGHPAPRTVRLLQSLGMTVLRTDLQGSVAITNKASGLAAVAQH